MKHRVNWDFELDGETFKAGDEIELNEKQLKSLGGSSVVTSLKDVPADVRDADKEARERQEAADKLAAEQQKANDEANARKIAQQDLAEQGENAPDAAPTAGKKAK
jgi:hypothetical protein